MVRFILIALWVCCVGLPALAQQSSFNFRKLGISEGLHDGTIRCVAQDTFGFIWIGSAGALNRFDSRNVEVFTYDMEDSNSVYPSQPRCMHTDKQGRFWIGYEAGLLEYMFKTGTFRKVRTLERSLLSAMVSINDSTMFVGGGGGLIRLNTRTDDTFFYMHSSALRYAALLKANVRDIEYREPYLYLATTRGLILFHIAKDSAFAMDIPLMQGQEVDAVDLDRKGDIWMASYTNLRLTRLQSDWKTLDVYDKWLSSSNIITQINLKDVLVDNSDNVWFISATEGLMQYVREKDIMIKHKLDPLMPSGLNTNNFRNLFQDRNGMIWAGGDIGVVYFNPIRNFFSVLRPFPTDLWERDRRFGRSVTVDNQGTVWMGTHDGLSSFDQKTGQYHYWCNEKDMPPQIYSNLVRSLLYADQWVWIGTSTGVNRYDLVNRKMEFVSEKDLPLTFYNSITCDRSGNIWFATNDTSAVYWYSIREKKYHSIHEIPPMRKYERYTTASYVHEDRKHRLWFSYSRKGIVCYDKLRGTTTLYDTKQDSTHRIIGNQVIDIKEDRKGVIWVSSLNGVSGIDVERGKIQSFNRRNGLNNNWVSPLVVDSYDRIWIGASGGLSMLEKDRKTMTTFTLADGLPSVGFPEHAGIIDSKGVIWMGTYNGYLNFNTHEYKPVDNRIRFYATNYRSTDGISKRLDIADEDPVVHLDAGEKAFTFEITALNFPDPTQTRFAYRLEGFENDWHYSQDGKAVYTNIPGGDYQFQYKAVSGNTQWDSIAAKHIRVEIGSFFYQKRWFWIVLMVVIFGSLWLYYRSRLSNQRRIYELQIRADALQKENALVMFEGLKQQLNPHFLFNSLTSLSGLIREDTRQASRFLERLGKLYRYVLNSQDNETVTLGDEIQFAETYLHLQRTRFGEGLVFVNEVDIAFHQKRIAPVTLQKLIENAIKHNIIDAESPLQIRLFVTGDYLAMENNLQRKNYVESSNNKGLSSLLRLYSYISSHPIIIEDGPDFFTVKIPLL